MFSRTSGTSARAVRSCPRRVDRRVASADDRQYRHQTGDVEDPLHARLDRLADADDEALIGLERAAAGVQQRAEHRGVDERGAREVDDDASAAPDRLVQPLAQRRRGVDVVLALDDDDHHVPGAVVQHDRIGIHVVANDTRRLGRSNSPESGRNADRV
jgi:hypothetical protein